MSTNTQRLAPSSPQQLTSSRRRLLRAGTVVAAAVTGAIGWIVAAQLIGLQLSVVNLGQAQDVSLASAIVGGLVPGLAAWALLAILERFAKSARLIWTVIAIVVLVLSLASPLMAQASLSTTIALLCLHVAVGAVLIIGLRRSSAAR